MSRIHYDLSGQRVFEDRPGGLNYVVYADPSFVYEKADLNQSSETQVLAFGERIAFKRSFGYLRTAELIPFEIPWNTIGGIGAAAMLGLLVWAARRGALVLVVSTPGQAGVAMTTAVVFVIAPVPMATAGGGGAPVYYWELSDPLGTGMVVVDESGDRVVHRTFSPFGREHASAGTGGFLRPSMQGIAGTTSLGWCT